MKTVQDKQPPAAGEKLREDLQQALSRFATGPLRESAGELLNALGYHSERYTEAGSVKEFLDTFDADQKLTAKQLEALGAWRAVEIVFQVTSDEISAQENLFGQSEFDKGLIKSFLFLAVDLETGSYNRTALADMTRSVNRLFEMPAIVLFRHASTMTLSVIHRRVHKRDDRRVVLKKVTLIKDVVLANPHRAHLDILTDLSMQGLAAAETIRDFDALHNVWESKLDIEELNRRFYRELFEWFERAAQECSFPDDGAGKGNNERHVIRLITRLLFIWFLKEKRLVRDELFKQKFAKTTLKNHDLGGTDYYRAVLQNLFFATLNTAIDKRDFSAVSNRTHRDFNKYRYRKLLTDPDGFLDKLKTVPFVNGGLFDCLDDFEGVLQGGRRIDAFTDHAAQGRGLDVPARLFFDDEGLFPLFHRYKFTVEENTPLDREVALDPELLGRTFENLLGAYNPETSQSARKATGSYYTPRSIVDYMVDEALLACFLKNTPPFDGDRGYLEDRLRLLLAFDQDEETARTHARKGKTVPETDHLIDKTEIGPLIAAIDNLKILDPACGSGAFPMGILQKLVLVLAKLDPRNERWKARQIEKAESIDDPQAREKAVAAVESAFAPERGFGGFGRKLYLIRNAVHGVDIQPVACQIAKLRFFISLVIEQPTNKRPEDNYGIQPLPNLETRFVAAETLIGLGKPAQQAFGKEEIQTVEDELRSIRERYFSAQDRKAKLACMERDRQARKKLAGTMERLGFPHDAAEAVAHWDPYDQNASASWFDPEWMFGLSEGFDIVIGNPPYVRGEKIEGKARLREAFGEFYGGSADIYTYFFKKGVDLLAEQGLLCFIASNKFMRAGYGKPLRELLKQEAPPRWILDFGLMGTFDASTWPAILLCEKGGGHETLRAAVVRSREDMAMGPGRFMEEGGFSMPVAELADEGWSLTDTKLLRLRDKIKAAGKPLADYLDEGIFWGIKTGFNDAFVIDADTRARLIAEDPKSEDLIRPWLRGRDVRKWCAAWAGVYVIAIASSVNKRWPWSSENREAGAASLFRKTYPAIHDYLFQFKDRLRKRQDKGTFFWELRSCAYYAAFEEPKIIYPDIGREIKAFLDKKCRMTGNTCYIIPGDDAYLLALLNSTLLDFYFRLTLICLDDPFNGGRMRFFSADMEHVPIAPADAETKKRLSDLATKIQKAREANAAADISTSEREIDHIVYQLYGLDECEATLIQKTVGG